MVSGVSTNRLSQIIEKHIEHHKKAAKLHSDTVQILQVWLNQRIQSESSKAPLVWTPERLAYLSSEWTSLRAPRDIWMALNKMEGSPISSPKSVGRQAERMGLKRYMKVLRPKGLTHEDRAEGDEYIRAGWSAEKLAEWFGCAVEDAAKWRETLMKKVARNAK